MSSVQTSHRPPYRPENPSTPAGLELQPLLTDKLLVVLPCAHPLAKRSSVRATDLDGLPFILTRAGCERVILAALAERAVTPNVRHEVSEASSILAMVSENLGVSVMPALAAHTPAAGVVLRPLSPAAPRQLSLAVPQARTPSPAVRAFLAEAAAARPKAIRTVTMSHRLDQDRVRALLAGLEHDIIAQTQEVDKLAAVVGDLETVADAKGWLPAERRAMALTLFKAGRGVEVRDFRVRIADGQAILKSPQGNARAGGAPRGAAQGQGPAGLPGADAAAGSGWHVLGVREPGLAHAGSHVQPRRGLGNWRPVPGLAAAGQQRQRGP